MTRIDERLLKLHESDAYLIGKRILHVEETHSTNDLAHECANDSNSPGLVIVADHQTAGRGQQGRSWYAPAGTSLLFSVVLSPEPGLESPSFLTAWAASAVADTIRSLGPHAQIKWPNDIRVGGRKVCGILTERRQAIVVGVGINVSIPPKSFPTDLRQPGTSLATELSRDVDRSTLLIDVLERLDQTYADARRNGPMAIWERWPSLSEHEPGQRVVATVADREVEGVLVSLRPDQGVRLQADDGLIYLPAEHIVRIEPSM